MDFNLNPSENIKIIERTTKIRWNDSVTND